MSLAGTRRLCRVGLAAVLVTAFCVLTLLDSPPQLPDPPVDSPPTPGGEVAAGTRSIVAYSWARRLALDYRPSKECEEGNGTHGMATAEAMVEAATAINAFTLLSLGGKSSRRNNNSNKSSSNRSSKWVETIPGQLFLYSAHLDFRLAGYPKVRVIAVKRGALPNSALFCTIWHENQSEIRSFTMEALVSSIWLEEWGSGSLESYTGILLSCQLPLDNSIEPSRIYVGPTPCQKNASHSLVIGQESRSGLLRRSDRRQFTLCIKGLDFEEDISLKVIAFIEFHRILGADLFYFYVFNVHENVLKVLRLYERSNVIRWFNLTLPGNLPNERSRRRRFFNEDVSTKRRMELIPYNHCFYENLHHSEYIVPLDIDETIVPAKRKTWNELLFDERIKLGKSFKDFASYSVRNAYFFPELRNRSLGSTPAGLLAPPFDYLDTLRSGYISPEGDSVKSFVSTRRALIVHNHYALTTLNPSTRRAHHLDPEDVLKHHHRTCDSKHLDCDLLMEDIKLDQSALRYAPQLEARVKMFIANLEASLT